jgi:hypothetical protein
MPGHCCLFPNRCHCQSPASRKQQQAFFAHLLLLLLLRVCVARTTAAAAAAVAASGLWWELQLCQFLQDQQHMCFATALKLLPGCALCQLQLLLHFLLLLLLLHPALLLLHLHHCLGAWG